MTYTLTCTPPSIPNVSGKAGGTITWQNNCGKQITISSSVLTANVVISAGSSGNGAIKTGTAAGTYSYTVSWPSSDEPWGGTANGTINVNP